MTSIVAGTKAEGTLTGTALDVPYKSGEAENGTKLIDGATAQFRADLKSPGDSVTYTITIKNSGNINAKIKEDGIEFSKGSNTGVIDFTCAGISDVAGKNCAGIVDNNPTTINAGATKTFTVTVTYVDIVGGQQQPADNKLSNTLTMHINFVQA